MERGLQILPRMTNHTTSMSRPAFAHEAPTPIVERSIPMMVLWTFLTFGIYQFFWLYSTKEEMNERGADIPTMWLIIVPFANIYWFWRYSEGIPLVTEQQDHHILGFVLCLFAGGIGPFVLQWMFNNAPTNTPSVPRAVVR